MDEPTTTRQAPRTLTEAQARGESPVNVPPPVQPAPVEPASPGSRPNIHSNKRIRIIAAFLVLGIVVSGFLYIRSSKPPEEVAPVEVTPTAVPSPTPPPNLSRISTTSAFRSYSEDVASFSAILNAFALQDATLVPPILDIELELKN
ncbi:MAG: hypothetical protein AAB542_00060 [Patescibacteria group bacterium]